ncbi:hypothetical protein ABT160_18005 [Streptomyces sp. NPDC001941]|uniref:hypothetical protein n=1 Tax=Streptomyces sp. NPDC001941 TaxID=3154659 RepID=UPI0033343C2E
MTGHRLGLLSPASAVVVLGLVCVGFAVVAVVALRYAVPDPHRAFEDPPPPGTEFRCYCYRHPVHVRLVEPHAPRRPRHARPRGARDGDDIRIPATNRMPRVTSARPAS